MLTFKKLSSSFQTDIQISSGYVAQPWNVKLQPEKSKLKNTQQHKYILIGINLSKLNFQHHKNQGLKIAQPNTKSLQAYNT